MFYYQTLGEIRRGAVAPQSRSLATAGMITGWIGVALGVVVGGSFLLSLFVS